MACQWQIYSDSKAEWQGSPSLREVMGLQRNHKLTGSLNVTLSFPPSCLGRGLQMLLIWYLHREETGTRALHGSCSYSPYDSPVSPASVHFPLQVGGCQLPQLSRTCQCQQSVYKPTPSSRLSQPSHPVQHVPPRACTVPIPQRGGHRPAGSDAEEGCEAPGRQVPSAGGEGPGLSSEEGPVPGGFWQSCAGDGCGSRRGPGRPPHSGDHQCATRHSGEPAASRNAVRGTVCGQLGGVGCQICPLWNVAVNPFSPFQLPSLWCPPHPPHHPGLQQPSCPSGTSDTACLLHWMCSLPSPGEETLGHLPVLVTHRAPLVHQGHFPAE